MRSYATSAASARDDFTNNTLDRFNTYLRLDNYPRIEAATYNLDAQLFPIITALLTIILVLFNTLIKHTINNTAT